MPLRPIPFDPDFHDPPPDKVIEIFSRAEAAGKRFTDMESEDRLPALVSTTAHVAWPILRAVERLPVNGRRLVEWGSGMGAVTLAAAHMGWEAEGIELEPALVAASTQLAAELGVTGVFHAGSYSPEGVCPIDPCAADVVFVFAWPVEVGVVTERFAEGAAPGTILVRYRGGITVEAFVKA